MSDYLLHLKTPHVPLQFAPQRLLSSSPSLVKFKSPSVICSYGVSRKDLISIDAATDELEVSSSVELERITGEKQFDLVLGEAQRIKKPVVILWTANWCRKCIYLKPKLEKLAADYYPRVRFYYIDVNSVPQSLVNRAGVTKMPTIQLWSDFKIQGEINGGYTSWMVIEDIKRMIDNEEP